MKAPSMAKSATSTSTPTPTQRAMLRRPQVEAITGLSRSTLYRLVAESKFPSPVRLSERCVAWPSDLVAGWVEARCTA